MAAPVFVFAGLAVVSVWFPQLPGNGKDGAQLGFDGTLGIDEKARLAGRISAADARHPGALPPVLSIAAAADLMRTIKPLDADASEAEALERLRAEPTGELPVVDRRGRLVGAAISPRLDDGASFALPVAPFGPIM